MNIGDEETEEFKLLLIINKISTEHEMTPNSPNSLRFNFTVKKENVLKKEIVVESLKAGEYRIVSLGAVPKDLDRYEVKVVPDNLVAEESESNNEISQLTKFSEFETFKTPEEFFEC